MFQITLAAEIITVIQATVATSISARTEQSLQAIKQMFSLCSMTESIL